MTKIMMLGDTHGDLPAYLEALDFCIEHKIKHVFLMGDCGLFPYFSDTQEYLDEVNELSKDYGICNWWVRGNHDDPDAWQATIDHWPGSHGSGKIRSNIYLLPRTRVFTKFNLNFLVVGGAVSIDRQWRQRENAKAGRNIVWWPDEIISDADILRAFRQSENKKIDILLSHECSDYTPWKNRLKADLDSQSNRHKLDRIIKRTRPGMHFHGHMHEKYEWDNYMIHEMNFETKTFGLECNAEAMRTGEGRIPDNWYILDTDTLDGTWRREFNNKGE